VHLLQIWLFPEARGLTPGYAQQNFPAANRRGRLQLVASHDGRDGSLSFKQDASIYVAALDAGQRVTHPLAPGRGAWVQVATGAVRLNGQLLNEGDGAAVDDETTLELVGVTAGETLVFDLA
jgi:redox-sensitive bicupin YhaK (pirin superfamily)